MPKISNKGRNIPSSPIRKLVPFSDKAKEKGIDVLHLNIGQPDIESPVESIQGIRQNELKLLKYEYSQGSHGYRTKPVSYTHLTLPTILLV